MVINEAHNTRIYLVAAILLSTLSLGLQAKKLQCLAILINIILVIATKIFNTAIENSCAFISPQKHASAKRISDISAAAVLARV